MILVRPLLAVVLFLACPAWANSGGQVRAESPFLDPSGHPLVRNAKPYHRWLAEGDSAFLLSEDNDGHQLALLSPTSEDPLWSVPLKRVVQAIANQGVPPPQPGFFKTADFDVLPGGKSLNARIGGRLVDCTVPTMVCTSAPIDTKNAAARLVSPDGRLSVERCGHDVCLAEHPTGTRRRLTFDGAADDAYAIDTPTSPFMLDRIWRGDGEQTPIIARWSPDSQYVVVSRIDNTAVPNRALTQFAPEEQLVPREARVPQAWFIDDARPLEQLYLIHVRSGTIRPLFQRPVPLALASEISAGRIDWAADSASIYYMSLPPGRRSAELVQFPVAGGAPAKLVSEQDINPLSPAKKMLKNGEFLWISEKDGYRHIYLHDAKGRVKHQVTKGKFVVNRILAVHARHVFAEVTQWPDSKDPLHRFLIKVNIDRARALKVTAVDADYRITGPDPRPQNFGDSTLVQREASMSPTARYFIATRSTLSDPPVTVLGSTVQSAERVIASADISALLARGFVPPERVQVTAADGKTQLFGTIHRPSSFRSDRRYPVVEYIYTGGQISQATPDFMTTFGDHQQALADLGYIVVLLDGRMTANRDYAFRWPAHDERERDMLNDHVSGLKQLAARFPEMDIDRLGIFGLSAGGGATVAALLNYPDFYKVGVALAGSYDNRTLVPGPGEAQAGCAPPASGCKDALDWYTLAPKAGQLKGKLLLVASDVDEIVPLTVTMQLVRSFIDQDRLVDMFIIPNLGHLEIMGSPYIAGLIQTYFRTHLPPGGTAEPGTLP